MLPASKHRRTSTAVLSVLIAGAMAHSPESALGFKFDTHVWLAQQVLNDLLPDGKLTIEHFGEITVNPAIVAALRSHPDHFRMGSIGPDAFPDLIAGQLTTHPGVPGGKATDWWLDRVLSRARTPAESFLEGLLAANVPLLEPEVACGVRQVPGQDLPEPGPQFRGALAPEDRQALDRLEHGLLDYVGGIELRTQIAIEMDPRQDS